MLFEVPIQIILRFKIEVGIAASRHAVVAPGKLSLMYCFLIVVLNEPSRVVSVQVPCITGLAELGTRNQLVIGN